MVQFQLSVNEGNAMKRIWIQRIGAAVLCAVLLAGCMPGGPAADSTASADPLTGQEQQYPGQRPAAVVIDNAPGSTTQWGIGSASVVLEAAAVRTPPPACAWSIPPCRPCRRWGRSRWGRTCSGGCSAASRCCPSSAAATCTPAIFWTTGTCARWTRWKQAATPSPPAIPTGPARCGAPTVNLWPRCWAA